VLDVGVGTGRFAKPLCGLGFEVVGIDVSRRMMLKARQKGVENLILADAHRMPFNDESFDASIIIHVLHLIPDWLNVVREMGRVTRSRVAALLRNRQREWANTPGLSGDSSATTPAFPELWTRYAELREKMGYPIRRNRRMWQNEEEIRSQLPPMKLVKISDEVVVTSVSDLIARFQQRAYPMLQDIPRDVHDRIIQKLISSLTPNNGKETASTLQEKQVERRIIEELAVWRPDQLRPE
jgi:ubiquinone/menaquinone biosynthesis C-methylase UbiE